MNKKSLYILATAIIGVMIVGQFMVYGVNPYYTSANSWSTDSEINYELSSNTFSDYSLLLMSEGIQMSDEIIIFHDSDYKTHYDELYVDTILNRMCSELSIRNLDYVIMDSQRLLSEMEHDIDKGKSHARLLILTGVLPDTVYRGKSDDLIFKWLSIGATLYWTGHTIGQSVSTPSEIITVNEGYGMNFFGIPDEDVRGFAHGTVLRATEKATDYEVSKSLSVMYNDSTFGINVKNLSNFKSIGYTSKGFDSVVLTKPAEGDGMIVIFGGELRGGPLSAIAQIIASKYTYGSDLIEHVSGKLDKTTVNGSFEKSSAGTHVLYVYLGQPQIYGRAFTH